MQGWMMGIAWRYRGPYGGCIGRHVAVRGMMWWESWEVHGGAEAVYWRYRGAHGSTGVSMVGVLGTRGSNRKQYGGAIERRVMVLGCPPDP